MKRLVIVIVGMLGIIPNSLEAQESAITNGVTWLEANQDASGLWGVDKQTPFRDATVVVDVFSGSGADPTAIANGLIAINDRETSSNDYLARKIIACMSADYGDVLSYLADSLANRQNDDGGWGYAEGYGSNVLETALALRALNSASFSESGPLGLGVNYLKTAQNANSGWPFVPGDSSYVFYTAHVIIALAPLADSYGATTHVQNAVDWLITQPHPDGGFGTGDTSNPFETGLALVAISQINPSETAAVDAYDYLLATQLPNGSWNDDAYSTAMALYGITQHQDIHGRSVGLSTGLNLLGLPVEPLDPVTSSELTTEIPGCSALTGWSRTGQTWLSVDFPVEMQDGFFVWVSGGSHMSVLGKLLGDNQCTILETGLNAISIPNEDACYSASTLIEDIDDCVEAHQWNQLSQHWVSLAKIDGDTLLGEDFSVSTGNGYFVRVTAGSEWCTHACDTITLPDLPDLLVTPDYIYINPNPAAPGELVEIYVNFENIGTDTAFSPSLVICEGDPDAGGTIIGSGYIPVDIPPGEFGGWWGGDDFTFSELGSVEIYGIADYYNEIVELDETNNKAHKTLDVLALTSVSRDLRTGGSRSELHLSPNPEITTLGGGNSQPFHKPTGVVNAAGVESHTAEMTSIGNVNAGNLTSSSATITWTTKVPVSGSNKDVGGCIHYGISSVEEHSACEAWWGGQVHQVELGGLSANTTYIFEVVSGDAIDDNGGAYYSFTTTVPGAGIPWVLYGQVLDTNSNPASGIIVSGTLQHDGSQSYPLTCLTNSDGRWSLNLGNIKDPVTGDVLSYGTGDTVFIAAQGGADGAESDTVEVSGSSPQDAGTIVLSGCDCGTPWGDLNDDGMINPVDAVIIINYVYMLNDIRAPLPGCLREAGDVNCDGIINPVDVVFYVNRVYMLNDMFCPDPCSP